MRFDLGEVIVTPKAYELLDAAGRQPEELLARHQAGDWGDVTPDERIINEEGVTNNLSLVSNYRIESGDRLMIFTKGDRSRTFVHVMPKTPDCHW